MQIMYAVYGGLMALIFMVFLAIDTQMLVGGKRLELDPEEYIFAATQLFLDIIYIFWFILQLLGALNNKSGQNWKIIWFLINCFSISFLLF